MQLSDFRRFISPSVEGCPDEMVRLGIIRAVRRLCNEAKVWREIQEPVSLQDGVSVYEPDAPSGGRVAGVSEVWCANRRLTRKTMRELPANWQTAQSSEPTWFNAAADFTSIRVFPIPALPSAQLTIECWYEPITDTESLPDFLMQRYESQIIDGAKATLMAMPRNTWTDMQLAAYHQKLFDDSIVTAAITLLHDRAQGSLRVPSIAFR